MKIYGGKRTLINYVFVQQGECWVKIVQTMHSTIKLMDYFLNFPKLTQNINLQDERYSF